MPSAAEMRRSTRIFGARVLRSGRRVSTGSVEVKHMKTRNVSEWIDLLDDSGNDDGYANHHFKEKGWHENDDDAEREVTVMDIDNEMECKLDESVPEDMVVDDHASRRWGIVYTRKRKKFGNVIDCSSTDEKKVVAVDKRFQKQYVRKRWRKNIRLSEMADPSDSIVNFDSREMHGNAGTLVIVVRPWCSCKDLVTGILTSTLAYITRARILVEQLSGFFFSKTVNDVYSYCGIHFLKDTCAAPKQAVCIILASSFFPLLFVDFPAIPSFFMYLHSAIQLQICRLVLTLSFKTSSSVEEGEDDRIIATSLHAEKDQASRFALSSVTEYVEVAPVVHSDTVKFAGRTIQLGSGRKAKKASSLRSKRGRPPSVLRSQKINSVVASMSPEIGKDSDQLPPRPFYHDTRSVARRSACSSIQPVESPVVGVNRVVDPKSCVANILVTESERCYREGGVSITLEISAGNRWHLVIKKNGVQKYSLIAQKFIRPCSCNRFTHAIMWSIENGWKLEFTERLEWVIFKELYKQCSDRNMHVPTESFIPIPGVRGVPDHLNTGSYFVRPVSYIRINDDELVRTLARKTANYDMESDDEEWLNKFNEENVTETTRHKLLSDEDFELIIDAFERGLHGNPDEYSDQGTAPSISVNVAKRVVEAVYGYWLQKRKQRRSALIRVFQLYQPRRTHFTPKSVLRKKRSFKRQGVQSGRGKQHTFLNAVVAEEGAQEHRSAVHKVKETKAAAKRSESVAVLKRQRAQQLMENADLATYKAVMALRIAELTQIAESDDALGLSSL